MTTPHDQDEDAAAGLEPTASDLDVPDRIAERTVGGYTEPQGPDHIISRTTLKTSPTLD